MLLLLDNYDSFVFNLARYFERLGQSVRVVRNDAIDVSQVQAMAPSAIVISPGPCTPTDAGVSLDIVRRLYTEFPILGVCLGHQVIAEAFGGRIVRSPIPVHGRACQVFHDESSLFESLPSPLSVGRYHSLVAASETLPADLRPTAWTEDRLIMAFEHVRCPVFGVQFHPESILTESGYEILYNFLRVAGLSTSGDTQNLAQSERPKPQVASNAVPGRPVTF